MQFYRMVGLDLPDPGLANGAGVGCYGNPVKGDVILQGRNNTDIIQKDREIPGLRSW